jgi:competence protein ComFB
MGFIERDSVNYEIEGVSLYEIANIHERTVLGLMREVYEADPSLCRCSLCVEDVYALSLNSLPPRYLQTTSLEVYEAGPHFIPRETVRAKILEAAAKVKAGPKH